MTHYDPLGVFSLVVPVSLAPHSHIWFRGNVWMVQKQHDTNVNKLCTKWKYIKKSLYKLSLSNYMKTFAEVAGDCPTNSVAFYARKIVSHLSPPSTQFTLSLCLQLYYDFEKSRLLPLKLYLDPLSMNTIYAHWQSGCALSSVLSQAWFTSANIIMHLYTVYVYHLN